MTMNHAALAQPATIVREHPNCRREAYLAHLCLIMGSLEQLAKFNPNEEHAFMLMLLDVKTIYDGRMAPAASADDDALDFGESLEAGMPEH